MRGVNKVTLLGRLGLDPNLQYTKAGVPVCNIRLATNEVFTDSDGEEQSLVEWHNVTVWGQRGLSASQRLTKGSVLYVEGRLESHRYTTKTGVETRSWNVVAKNIVFLPTEGFEGRTLEEASGT